MLGTETPMIGEEDVSMDIVGKYSLVVVDSRRVLEMPVRIAGGK